MKQKTKILGVRYTGRDQMKTYDKIEALAKRKDAFTSDIARALIKSGMVHNDNPEPEGKKESRLDRANRLKKKFISEVNSDMVNDNDNPGPGPEDKKKVTKDLLENIIKGRTESKPDSTDKVKTKDIQKITKGKNKGKKLSPNLEILGAMIIMVIIAIIASYLLDEFKEFWKKKKQKKQSEKTEIDDGRWWNRQDQIV